MAEHPIELGVTILSPTPNSPTDSTANLLEKNLSLHSNEDNFEYTPNSKCQRSDNFRRDKSSLDPHAPPESPVVHARAVPDGCTAHEMNNSLSKYGKIKYVTMMPKLRQSLIEFELCEAAHSCVKDAQENQQYIMGRPVFFNYSTSQEITRSPYGFDPKSPTSNNSNSPTHTHPTHILLYTVLNPIYPISVDILQTISSPCGAVQKIVIFSKNGVQALVEFESVESALRAKEALDGADIYSGCCTLRIEFSKTERLNVFRNDRLTWDYTMDRSSAASLHNLTYTPAGQHLLASQGHIPHSTFQEHSPLHRAKHLSNGLSPNEDLSAIDDPTPPPNSLVQSDTVVMIYGIDDRLNCDHIFNLLCSYGNIIKIKVLTNKNGIAMAQLHSKQAATYAIRHLNQQKLMGNNLEISISRHPFIADPPSGYIAELYDHSLAVREYSHSRNNRFIPTDVSSKNRIFSPTKVLHFYNAPPDSTNDSLLNIFQLLQITKPLAIRFFEYNGKARAGLMQWLDVESALNALVLANHATVHTSTNHQAAYTFKLAFSSSSFD
ncbi:Heterogeneous nuclear ribonucleoprotein L-like [Oopsacas minuta]|uniref:Heterogeneous nuclear ribonucleoprotein L-like n=1 Tax=Oopsacas minuta TaxID=111878 RepID=A0AAV7K950_9METZ|nr:Heterogeneous nuclear ribonucleoprotein L-like [Oopsacas minuta]